MLASRSINTIKNQQGLVLLVLVIAIVLAFASYSLSGLSLNQVEAEQVIQTRMALKEAKQALLAYAMNYTETGGSPSQGPGNLPCPAELNGVQKNVGPIGAGTACNSFPAGVIGRLPWKTLGMDVLYDGSGELLWYAVSNSYAAINSKEINSSTIGQIALKNKDGSIRLSSNSNDAIIAVIIAPGKALVRDDGSVQRRTTGSEMLDATNYLDIAYVGTAVEEDNKNFVNSDPGDNGFINGPIYNAANQIIVNDHIEVITYKEIMGLVQARVGDEFSNLINAYKDACDAYPEASPFNPSKVLPYDSAGILPPNELREGHLPLDSALPTNWGGVCGAGVAPVPAAWLKDEGWHKTTYYAFAYQNAPPANGLSCGVAPNPACLTINDLPNPAINNVQALIAFAGRDTTGNRPSANIFDYFENENNDLDDIYDMAELDDYIRVVTP